jgi:hypothetical protein
MSLKKFRLPGRNEKSSVSFVTAGLYLRFQRLGISFIYLEQMLLSATIRTTSHSMCIWRFVVYILGWGFTGVRNPLDHKSNTSCYILLVCFGCCVL